MKIVIVGKTRMHSKICVGGLAVENNQSMRLLTPTRDNHEITTDYAIGQVWDMNLQPRSDRRPPHVEDVLVLTRKLIDSQQDLKQFLLSRIQPWVGNIESIFDSKLLATTGGKGYITEENGIPNMSTGFWIPDKPLKRLGNDGKFSYYYPNTGVRQIAYVGTQEPVETIPSNALVRVSLARWWLHDGITSERCYLQLSGWFL